MSNSYINDFTKTTVLYYDDLKRMKPLTREDETSLIKEAKKNNTEARNKLIESNLKFVFSIASKYKGYGVPLADLISEGNLGLHKAIDKYDTSYDIRFINYAVFWVRDSIQNFLDKNHKKEQHESSIDAMLSGCGNRNSIEGSIMGDVMEDKEDERIDTKEMIASNEAEYHARSCEERRKELIEQILSKLDGNSRIIIEKCFGLDDGKAKTLEEISQIVHLSKERVRQIRNMSLKVLKSELMLMDNIDIQTFF